jgi:hypothetical protein
MKEWSAGKPSDAWDICQLWMTLKRQGKDPLDAVPYAGKIKVAMDGDWFVMADGSAVRFYEQDGQPWIAIREAK